MLNILYGGQGTDTISGNGNLRRRAGDDSLTAGDEGAYLSVAKAWTRSTGGDGRDTFASRRGIRGSPLRPPT